ncbi:MAG: OmpA/MotB domain protein [Fluviicola sp.]|jgi:outer membrane protein OmpA-like peptidoglycan-associated protein|uniref:OmpA family protein n=1 Tax=Fluviicola sp. TaxID=1917219 RepID=UPI002635551A|nr:OmpA family protein [Fluviicola sp.]MDF3027576.1 OmpA/MotB domain protein [Fluviicola sp.]
MKGLLHSLFILVPILSFSQAKTSTDSMSFYFEFNSHEISLQNKRNTETKTKLSKLRNQFLVLRAYTDSTGSKEYNLKLAETRLSSTNKWLKENFPGQFSIRTEIALGEDLSSKSDADKRRVDILVSSSQTTPSNSKTRSFELGVPIQLEIQFVYGRDEVLKSSYGDIQFLMETLQADKSLNVTLAGHVCCGTDGQNLSGKRAERIKQILVMEGNISGSRITAIGFGNKKPLFVEDSEEHRQANRRVEATFYKKQ